VVKEYCSKNTHIWEYTTTKWEEEYIHCTSQTYEEFIFRQKGKPLGKIFDEENYWEEARKRDEEDAAAIIEATKNTTTT